ncbi:MAG: DNA alkylation repair protein, partial [Chloroflexi bacterium]
MDTYESVMAELEAMGTAQNVKIYRRHGASSSAIFGVSAKNMN